MRPNTGLGITPSFTFATQAAPTSLTWDADATTAGPQNSSGVWDLQRPNFYEPVTKFNFRSGNARGNDVVFGGATAAGTVKIAAGQRTTGAQTWSGSAGYVAKLASGTAEG